MAISQNLRFKAGIPNDAEYVRPSGAALIRRLATKLRIAGWDVDEFDNWRDTGWSIVCRRESALLDLVVASTQDDEWLLQIAPFSKPGLIGRLLGRRPSASASDVHRLALAVHQTLAAAQWLQNPLWQWDNYPGDGASTEPKPPLEESS